MATPASQFTDPPLLSRSTTATQTMLGYKGFVIVHARVLLLCTVLRRWMTCSNTTKSRQEPTLAGEVKRL